jgi:hypothetical protein
MVSPLISSLESIPAAPNTTIYVRDKLTIRKGYEAQFKNGKQNLLSLTHKTCKLIAACGREPFSIDTPTQEPPPPMLHVWRLPDWRTLYDAMYYCSERPWYYELEQSLLRESQELLVDLRVGYGVKPRPMTRDHVYLYQEILLTPGASVNRYCLYLNRFAAEVQLRDWTWVWSASQITAEPGLLCFLWAARKLDSFRSAFDELRKETWFRNEMMGMVSQVNQSYMFPTDVESWDQQITDAFAASGRPLAEAASA